MGSVVVIVYSVPGWMSRWPGLTAVINHMSQSRISPSGMQQHVRARDETLGLGGIEKRAWKTPEDGTRTRPVTDNRNKKHVALPTPVDGCHWVTHQRRAQISTWTKTDSAGDRRGHQLKSEEKKGSVLSWDTHEKCSWMSGKGAISPP
jgi:hypothetical protein